MSKVGEADRAKHHALFESVKPVVVGMLRGALLNGARVDDLLFLVVDRRCAAAVDVITTLVAVDPESMRIKTVDDILVVVVVHNSRFVLESLLPESGLLKVDEREQGTVVVIVTVDDGHAVLGGFRPRFKLVS